MGELAGFLADGDIRAAVVAAAERRGACAGELVRRLLCDAPPGAVAALVECVEVATAEVRDGGAVGELVAAAWEAADVLDSLSHAAAVHNNYTAGVGQTVDYRPEFWATVRRLREAASAVLDVPCTGSPDERSVPAQGGTSHNVGNGGGPRGATR